MAGSAYRKVIVWIQEYVRQSDAHAGVASVVALVVASNQPFYPLYMRWLASPVIWPAYATLLSTPFFLAVPAVARRHPLFGKALLLVAGLGNTLLCLILFGQESGVGVFLIPCLVLSLLLFPTAEWRLRVVFTIMGFALGLMPDGAFGGPVHIYAAEEFTALRRLNFLSAAALTAMIALMFARTMDATSILESRTGKSFPNGDGKDRIGRAT